MATDRVMDRTSPRALDPYSHCRRPRVDPTRYRDGRGCEIQEDHSLVRALVQTQVGYETVTKVLFRCNVLPLSLHSYERGGPLPLSSSDSEGGPLHHF